MHNLGIDPLLGAPEPKATVQKISGGRGSTGKIVPSPVCHPHWDVAVSKDSGGSEILNDLSWGANLPIKRIFFYHVRKAGGTTVEKYLKMVTTHTELNTKRLSMAMPLQRSRNDTIYVTNLRDPVERSISHFKYEGRWSCKGRDGELMNRSFIPTKENARPFENWTHTQGFYPSPCDKPFYFGICAVQCYIQSFTGRGCTSDDWITEYHLALNRLRRYNIIISLEQIKDPRYREAVEDFFGVKGFGGNLRQWCGPESKAANKKVPLLTDPSVVSRLTRLNKMDYRLYRELTSCWDNDDQSEVHYSFPRANASRFVTK
ncbi:LOW QUALITY PROTEIN: hypothetical protein ACHAXT_004827 [Thalassiosira profunda]